MILSLYDYTGLMVADWIAAGDSAVIVDLQHTDQTKQGATALNWNIPERVDDIVALAKEQSCTFVAAFPPCTDLAVSGAAHFQDKLNAYPQFQEKALQLVFAAEYIAERLSVPYFIENPVSTLSSFWRKPDFIFDPYEYGGWLPAWDVHPQYHPYILPRDAYPKKTCLWAGGGFFMPPKKPVPVEAGWSNQAKYLGGRRLKTKNIRSATPRGFARAVCVVYCDKVKK